MQRRFWSFMTAAVLGLAVWAAGPTGLTGKGVSVAMAQSSSIAAVEAIAVMNTPGLSNVERAQKIADIAVKLSKAGGDVTAFARSFLLTAAVGGSTQGTLSLNASLATAAARVLATAATSNPGLSASFAAGTGQASANLQTSNVAGAAAAITSGVARGAGAGSQFARAVVRATDNTLVVSPAQVQCSGGSCN